MKPYTKAVNWWSFGFLMFRMLTGMTPFYDDNINKMYRAILKDSIYFPSVISPVARDLLEQLVDQNS
jgi:serine/threonine protein kinase